MTPAVRQMLNEAEGWTEVRAGSSRKLKDGRALVIIEDVTGVVAGLQHSHKGFARFNKNLDGVKQALEFSDCLARLYGGWAE